MTVRALMNPNVKYSGTDASAADVAGIMEKDLCGAVMVVNIEMRPLGIVTDRDICIGLARRGRTASDVGVTELMSKRIYACSPDEPLEAALRTMREKRIRRLPVVNRLGQLVGIITMEDIVRESGSGRIGMGYRETIDSLKEICAQASP